MASAAPGSSAGTSNETESMAEELTKCEGESSNATSATCGSARISSATSPARSQVTLDSITLAEA